MLQRMLRPSLSLRREERVQLEEPQVLLPFHTRNPRKKLRHLLSKLSPHSPHQARKSQLAITFQLVSTYSRDNTLRMAKLNLLNSYSKSKKVASYRHRLTKLTSSP